MNPELTLAIDQGTHSTRALLFTAGGQLVTTAQYPLTLHRISDDRIEQDGREIIASLFATIEEVMAHEEVARRGIARAGLASQRSSVIAWNMETGQPLGPMLSWQDRRAVDWLAQFADEAAEVKERTGLPLSPHYGASKMRWLLENEPEVQQAHKAGRMRFGQLAGFLLFNLLKEKPLVTDQANAGRTLLQNLDSLDWDPWLLDIFGVPAELLTGIRPSIHEYGTLAGSSIPLTAVCGDQNGAIYGLGLPEPGTGIVNLGTGAFVLVSTGAKRVRHPRLLSGLASSAADSREYSIEGTVNGAAAAIKWAAEEWDIPNIDEHLHEWLEIEDDPPLFLNTIGGLGSPFWQSGPEPTIIQPAGYQREYSTRQKVVAVLESILFLLQVNMDAIAALGLEPKRLRVSGGLANVDALCQRLADLSDKPVYRPKETEATVRGAAWLASGRPSYWPESEPGDHFYPEHDPAFAARYEAFRNELNTRLD